MFLFQTICRKTTSDIACYLVHFPRSTSICSKFMGFGIHMLVQRNKNLFQICIVTILYYSKQSSSASSFGCMFVHTCSGSQVKTSFCMYVSHMLSLIVSEFYLQQYLFDIFWGFSPTLSQYTIIYWNTVQSSVKPNSLTPSYFKLFNSIEFLNDRDNVLMFKSFTNKNKK